jgi:hypothetical protein
MASSCYDRFPFFIRHRMTMSRLRKRPASPHRLADDEIRNQEVLRATRELAAYFKGRRTEREARAALKIIKAFIRERERADPATRRPLPIAGRKQPTIPRTVRRRILRPVASHPAAHSAAAADPDVPPKKDHE